MTIVFLPLSRGKVAVVDWEDYHPLRGIKWSAIHTSKHLWYAHRNSSSGYEYLHRRILGRQKGDGVKVDHRNGDGLDNRRENLREGTHQQNLRGFLTKYGKTSRFRGVSWRSDTQKWEVHIRGNRRKHIHGGCFFTEREAALAWNELATSLGYQKEALNVL